jgi:hypothetical protein
MGITAIKLFYDILGPDVSDDKKYSLTFKNHLDLKRYNKTLVEATLPLPEIRTKNLYDFLKAVKEGDVQINNCGNKKSKKCKKKNSNVNKKSGVVYQTGSDEFVEVL